jgi:hypothetical protein
MGWWATKNENEAIFSNPGVTLSAKRSAVELVSSRDHAVVRYSDAASPAGKGQLMATEALAGTCGGRSVLMISRARSCRETVERAAGDYARPIHHMRVDHGDHARNIPTVRRTTSHSSATAPRVSILANTSSRVRAGLAP